MMNKRISIVVGTRPEVIKMAPIIKLLQDTPSITVNVIATGQHEILLKQALSSFDIKADYNLEVMEHEISFSRLINKMISGLEEIFVKLKPDLVLVHGDTYTTLAASLSAVYNGFSVGHVEAGLRTYNKASPWPEEVNRQVVSRLACYNFAPTEYNKNNLISENVKSDDILVTGNTVIDALYLAERIINQNIELKKNIDELLLSVGLNFNIEKANYILITTHRRENFGRSLKNICTAILNLSHTYSDFQFILPVHLNPNVRDYVVPLLSNKRNIHLIEPLDYFPFIWLMKHSFCILTDSGGIQEEAPSFNIPVLVMRDTTERQEGIEAGTIKLVGTENKQIESEVHALVNDTNSYKAMQAALNPYGDGTAAKKICKYLIEKL